MFELVQRVGSYVPLSNTVCEQLTEDRPKSFSFMSLAIGVIRKPERPDSVDVARLNM